MNLLLIMGACVVVLFVFGLIFKDHLPNWFHRGSEVLLFGRIQWLVGTIWLILLQTPIVPQVLTEYAGGNAWLAGMLPGLLIVWGIITDRARVAGTTILADGTILGTRKT